MVSLSVSASPLPYSQQEILTRDLIASRGTFRQDLPERFSSCLPWSKRPTSRLLEHGNFNRLFGAFEHAQDLAVSKTVLIAETNAMWLVNIARNPDGPGFRLTWRFICSE